MSIIQLCVTMEDVRVIDWKPTKVALGALHYSMLVHVYMYMK